MRVNVTMLARNRHRLTEQALRSLISTTDHPIVVLDDESGPEMDVLCTGMLLGRTETLYRSDKSGGAGIARNKVIKLAAGNWKGELLYLSDNDVVFLPRWLDLLCELWPAAYASGFRVLAGYQHPYNRTSLGAWPQYSEVMGRTVVVHETLAVATQSWLMDWETWDKYGPFAEAPGVRQSEDVDMCNRIRREGGKVGFVWPPCVLNTSLSDTFGKDVPGAELLRGEMQEGIVYE